ncbi:MAG: hypothetical protein M3P51_04155 [Chloroflexota bacterium]|nr:hypothetical protein [Chloroflexota bacterium]
MTGVTSSSEPDGDPERNFDVTVAAGDTVRIDIGAGTAGSDNIFDNELNESATVYTSAGNVTPTCEEAAGIGVGLGDGDEVTIGEDDQDDQQDDQQQTDNQTVTKTFELTLNGDVPEGEVFRVFLDIVPERGGSNPAPVQLCGGVDINGDPNPECEGNGTVYTGTTTFSVGTTLEYEFHRQSGLSGVDEIFAEGQETLNADMTNTAWYTFGTGAGEDQQGEMPGEMPHTGAGGLATGASVPWGTLGLAASGLLAAGYAVMRRR